MGRRKREVGLVYTFKFWNSRRVLLVEVVGRGQTPVLVPFWGKLCGVGMDHCAEYMFSMRTKANLPTNKCAGDLLQLYAQVA